MKNIILLHGALGSAKQFTALSKELSSEFKIHSFDFSGHGDANRVEDFSLDLFSEDLQTYISDHKIEGAHIFGYSMGGYVALRFATQQSVKIGKIITLATKFAWDDHTAFSEAAKLDADAITEKVPQYAAHLEQLHGAKWKSVLKATADMMKDMPAQLLTDEQFSAIENSCMLMAGDSDKMVSIDETVYAAKKISGSSLCILPETPHPLNKVDPYLLSFHIKYFLN